MCFFYVYPALRGFALAFSDGWIGGFSPSLSAWGRVFVPNFWRSLKASLIYASVCFPLTAVVVAVTIVLQPLPKGFVTFIQTAMYLPVMASGVAMALIWKWLFHPTRGPLNLLLGHEILWLANPAIAPLSIAAVVAPPAIGNGIIQLSMMVVQIPPAIYEQATMDGCGSWRTALRITIPILLPFILFYIFTMMITGFRVFAPLLLLTRGGPAHSTSSMSWLVYETAFMGSDLPRAMATALITSIILFPLYWLVNRSVWREI